MERDYSKFLRDDGRLNVRLLPRPVYIQMVKRHQLNDSVVEEVFTELYWMWDVRKRAKQAAEEGRQASYGEIGQEILNSMEDKDWWRVTSTFEEHLIGHFGLNPSAWADLIDPVYDVQEANGWDDIHYAPWPPPAAAPVSRRS